MRMNKIKKFFLLILAIIPFIEIAIVDLPSINNNKELAIECSVQEFDYEELKENSPVIALVEIVDDLNSDNSVINYLDDSITISGFYGKRNAKVIKYYKNERECDTNLTIIEPAVITKDNEYIHLEEYEKMELGNKYIVFLSDETESGNLSILSGNNGKINVSNFNDNDYPEILVKSLIEFETPESILPSDSKDVILNSEQINMEYKERAINNKENKILNETIKTNLGDLKLETYYDTNLQNEIINIDEITLISDDKLIIK